MLIVLLISVTVISALIATGFSLAGVLFPGFMVRNGEGSPTARVFALYGLKVWGHLVLGGVQLFAVLLMVLFGTPSLNATAGLAP